MTVLDLMRHLMALPEDLPVVVTGTGSCDGFPIDATAVSVIELVRTPDCEHYWHAYAWTDIDGDDPAERVRAVHVGL